MNNPADSQKFRRTSLTLRGMNLWKLSFRPFFLFGSLFSFLATGFWMAVLFGLLPYRGSLLPVVWHSHEMVYGFSTAIIAGFVLTAVQNWSGRPGIRGLHLQLLFAVWLLPRILLAVQPRATLLVSGLDLLFFPLLGSALVPYLRDPELKTERVFIAYFGVFFIGNILVHLDAHGFLSGYAGSGIRLGLHSVILVIIFMGGRVIPFFTESSIAKSQPKTFSSIEILSHTSAWFFLFSMFFAPVSNWTAGVALFAGLIHSIRLSGWYVRRIRRVAILWILHVAYLWIIAGLILSALASLEVLPLTLATHAFTVGAVGSIIYGMITRVSLGHTGRPLKPSVLTMAGYLILSLSAVVRVFGPMLSPRLYAGSLAVAGGLWMLAFLFFIFEYTPILTTARIDGRDG